MEIKVKRFEFGTNYTIGRLYINGELQCFTLEDRVRDTKIAGVTAIPAGRYKVILDMSNRFKKIMPHILNVPGFEGVRIHSGNTDADTEGCILLGSIWSGGDYIGNSRAAFTKVFNKLQACKEPMVITIE